MKNTTELHKLSTADLHQRLEELRKQLIEQKRARAAGELANPHAKRKTRRDIAAVLTLLNNQPAEPVKQDEEKK